MRKRAVIFLFAAVAAATALSAQVTTQFRAERARLEAAFNLKGQTENEILRNRMINPFESPNVRIQKVLPGGSFAVTVRGNFPAGTAIPVRAGRRHAFRCLTFHDHLFRPRDDPAG